MEKRYTITITTDGACSGNPGPGGYAAILRVGTNRKEVFGYVAPTEKERPTNNRMELKAVVEAVKILKSPCDITFRTDSQYICTGIANLKGWSENNWCKKTGGRCANDDLWKELLSLKTAGKHSFQYLHVDGHAGDPDNEECDRIAKNQIRLGRA